MPRITQIQQVGQEVIVYIDSEFCMSMRLSVLEQMNLHEGSNISCSQLKRKANFYWKQNHMLKVRDRELYWQKTYIAYGLENEEKLVSKAMKWVIKYLPELEVKRIDQYGGVGPNLSLLLKGSIKEILAVKVLTAGTRVGTDHWIRLNLVEYIQKNPDSDIWVTSCFKYPKQAQMAWVKLDQNKDYRKSDKATGSFMFFDDQSSECYTARGFCDYVRNKIKEEVACDNN